MKEWQDEKGRFKKGYHASKATEFKKGQRHWRPCRVFHRKEYLIAEYVEKKRSSGDLAKEHGVTDSAIQFWLKRHGILRRTVSQTRKVKYWGNKGKKNGMYGKRGEKNPHWKGGITPERQAFYSTEEWIEVKQQAYQRDDWTCQRCGLSKKENPHRRFCLHHIAPFGVKRLRATLANLALLCAGCHSWVHSKANVRGRFLAKMVRGGQYAVWVYRGRTLG